MSLEKKEFKMDDKMVKDLEDWLKKIYPDPELRDYVIEYFKKSISENIQPIQPIKEIHKIHNFGQPLKDAVINLDLKLLDLELLKNISTMR